MGISANTGTFSYHLHRLKGKGGIPMEQNLHTPEIYDFRQHDRLWQRVNPALEPYPETAAETIPARGGQITQPANSGSLTAAQESQLPARSRIPAAWEARRQNCWRCWRGTSKRSWRISGGIWRWPGRRRPGRGRPCGRSRRTRALTPAAAVGPVSHYRAVLPPQHGAGAAVHGGLVRRSAAVLP